METLDKTDWDVLIVGTGLQQSLLALALSRSEKKVLHIDENDYYGGAEAAFSLKEAEVWAQRVNEDANEVFSSITITKVNTSSSDIAKSALSASRSYSLALSPQIIYARSSLLQVLVASKVYRQLEFVAVGSWWVYQTNSDALPVLGSDPQSGRLLKVPNGREDVFQNHELDFKAKRALMKFLRFLGEYEEQEEVWGEHRQQPFQKFLSEQFNIPLSWQAPLSALTLSTSSPDQTNTEYALSRITKYLRSMGFLGAGFGAVVPKWGGLSEISQVSCRACAVGGGVYVLGKTLSCADDLPQQTGSDVKVRLKDGETISTKWVVGGKTAQADTDSFCKSITIISSPLTPLFPPVAEETPLPASAVVVFPSGSLSVRASVEEHPPVHVFVHSSDTSECPAGQCILYSVVSSNEKQGFDLLHHAVEALLSSVAITPTPRILWSVKYQQRPSSGSDRLPGGDRVLQFPVPTLDLAFEDAILDNVKNVWKRIMGNEAGAFLKFEAREAYDDDLEQ